MGTGGAGGSIVFKEKKPKTPKSAKPPKEKKPRTPKAPGSAPAGKKGTLKAIKKQLKAELGQIDAQVALLSQTIEVGEMRDEGSLFAMPFQTYIPPEIFAAGATAASVGSIYSGTPAATGAEPGAPAPLQFDFAATTSPRQPRPKIPRSSKPKKRYDKLGEPESEEERTPKVCSERARARQQ
jgi:hypothetical protein